jgi:hypothetical protein
MNMFLLPTYASNPHFPLLVCLYSGSGYPVSPNQCPEVRILRWERCWTLPFRASSLGPVYPNVVPKHYATAVLLDGYAQPVIAMTYSGRPTKLEGNPDHPVTQGRSDIFMQAAVLGLYDPDRAQGPTRRGEPVSWNDVADHIGALRAEWGRTRGEGLRLLTGPVTSPTLSRQLDTLLKQFPKARIHTHEPVGNGGRRNLTAAAYGQPLDVDYQLESCAVVVSFDDDLLGPGPDQVRRARSWSRARRRDGNGPGAAFILPARIATFCACRATTRRSMSIWIYWARCCSPPD